MESHLHCRCHGGPPLQLADPPWLATPTKLSVMKRVALWIRVCVIIIVEDPHPWVSDTPGCLPPKKLHVMKWAA